MSIQREAVIVVGRPRSDFADGFDPERYNLNVYTADVVGGEFIGYGVECGVVPDDGWCAGLRGVVEAFEVQTGLSAVIMPCIDEY